MHKHFLFLLAFLLLCLAEASGQRPPKLVVRNRVIQLESIPSRKDTSLVYHYRNEGDSALYIVRMAPGCTCLVPEYSEQALMPGDSARFTVRFTPSHAGPFSLAVTLVYAHPGSSKLQVTRVGVRGTAYE